MRKAKKLTGFLIKLFLIVIAAFVLYAYASGIDVEDITAVIYRTAEPDAEPPQSDEDFVFIESANILPEPEDEAEQDSIAEEAPPRPTASPEPLGADYLPQMTNQTEYEPDLTALLEAETPAVSPGGEPQILVVHTHSSESYTPDESYVFAPSDGARTLDTAYNVVRIGDRLCELLEAEGIATLHDREINDYPSYNGSYSRMLKVIKRYMNDYPSIKAVIDVHRDAVFYQSGEACPLSAEVNGETAAQLMYVVGTNEGGLAHDKWQQNLSLALKLQKYADEAYPGLMRGVNLRSERFNQHMTPGSLILEVGSSGNTLTEALRGVEYFARALLAVLCGL